MRYLLILLLILPALPAQTPSPAAPTPLFKTRVNMVTVPVVVRDQDGNAVGDLKQEDFQVFDRGKPQTIVRFAIETTASGTAEPQFADRKPGESIRDPFIVPERFVAYLFDDIHIKTNDLVLPVKPHSATSPNWRKAIAPRFTPHQDRGRSTSPPTTSGFPMPSPPSSHAPFRFGRIACVRP